jgi:hypothetical protein
MIPEFAEVVGGADNGDRLREEKGVKSIALESRTFTPSSTSTTNSEKGEYSFYTLRVVYSKRVCKIRLK